MPKPKPWFCPNCRKPHPADVVICPKQIGDKRIRADDYNKTVMVPAKRRGGRPKVQYTIDDAVAAMEAFMKTPFMQKQFPK